LPAQRLRIRDCGSRIEEELSHQSNPQSEIRIPKSPGPPATAGGADKARLGIESIDAAAKLGY